MAKSSILKVHYLGTIMKQQSTLTILPRDGVERVPNAAQNPSMASDVVGCCPAEESWGTVSSVTKGTSFG